MKNVNDVIDRLPADRRAKVDRRVEALSQQMTVNERMDAAIAKYGHCHIDYFQSPSQWRLWFRGYHQHYSAAMHGELDAVGSTIEQALDRLDETVRKYPTIKGDCDHRCPHYSDDCY